MASQGYPLINDISTDRERAPVYLVKPPSHPAYDAARLAAVTAAAYGDLVNLESARPPAEVCAAVEALVAERGWRVRARAAGAPASGAAQPPSPWRLQALAVTDVLRFKDDLALEVRPRPDGGSSVAMRSKSRLGLSDWGANAKRIRAFFADLRGRLGG